VSVSPQADTENADLARERCELAEDPASELAELTRLQQERGLPPALALEVAPRRPARPMRATNSASPSSKGRGRCWRPSLLRSPSLRVRCCRC
jgi:hypothetical protein